MRQTARLCLGLAASLGVLFPSAAQAQAWQAQPAALAPAPRFRVNATPQSVVPHTQPLQWQRVEAPNATPGAMEKEPPPLLSWQAVPPGQEIPPPTAQQPVTPLNNAALAKVPLPSGPTYANFRALWRDGDWFPQISNTVPVGFGPQGVMATLNYRAIDCITGAGECTVPPNIQAWKDQISTDGDAFFDTSIGFGDSLRAVGVVLTVISENTNTALLGRSGSEGEVIFGNANLGIHLSRHLGSDTAVRFGIDNLFRQDCYNGSCGLPQSAYGVISQRLRLNPDQEAWFANAYLTAGAGNGSFRDLGDQIQASYLAQRAAGCSTYGYQPKKDCSGATRRRAVFNAYDYGTLFPIAAVGLEVVKGFNLITEWSGRNLNAGLSFRPFPELGLVITPMFENLVANCDYGCRVAMPDYPDGAPLPSNVLTQRPRFSIQASVEIKF